MEQQTAGNLSTSDEGNEGATALAAAAAGDVSQEKSALDFLLGETQALEYDVELKYETPQGLLPMTLRFKQLDPDVIDRIDADHRTGDGPFAKLAVNAFNAELAATAGVSVTSGGRTVGVRSQEFIGGHPQGAIGAMGLRFKYQPGLLEAVAERIRGAAGYASDRVGTAQRVVVDMGKDSSS